jgi:hypothetical protein
VAGVAYTVTIDVTAFAAAAVGPAFFEVATGLTNTFTAQASFFPVGTFTTASAATVVAALLAFTGGNTFAHPINTAGVTGAFTAVSTASVVAAFSVVTIGCAGRVDAVVTGCVVLVIDPVAELAESFTVRFQDRVVLTLDQNVAFAFSHTGDVGAGAFLGDTEAADTGLTINALTTTAATSIRSTFLVE